MSGLISIFSIICQYADHNLKFFRQPTVSLSHPFFRVNSLNLHQTLITFTMGITFPHYTTEIYNIERLTNYTL